jgi:hypothetical protein
VQIRSRQYSFLVPRNLAALLVDSAATQAMSSLPDFKPSTD